MTELDLVPALNRLIFDKDDRKSKAYFPLQVRVDPKSAASEPLELLTATLETHGSVVASSSALDVSFHDKASCDTAVRHLLHHHWDVTFDYGAFATHPGTLFIKNLQKQHALASKIRDFFNTASQYALVVDVNVIGDDSDVLAILKFDNYLDVDHVLADMPLSPNPFSPGTPLYVNRYISKRERSSLSDPAPPATPDEAVAYDMVVIENLNEFLAAPVSLETLSGLLKKFELFNKMDTVYIPVANDDPELIRCKKVGFISFLHDRDLNVNILKCLYYLNNLTYDEVAAFGPDDIYDLLDDVNKPESSPPPAETARLKLSIVQRKHNHHVYENSESLFVANEDGLKLKISDPASAGDGTHTSKFLKLSNYQETNVYVNYFPILFENNDKLWGEFWNQFGVHGVKSAKIIKPQFYSKRSDDSLGKIGFVFYEEFKMALRAIILTNNKTIRFNDHHILIQASFAIQKHSHPLASGKLGAKFHHPNPLPNYSYYPNQDNFGKNFNMPMGGEPNYYMPEQIPNAGTSLNSPFLPADPYMFYPYFYPMQQFPPAEDNADHGFVSTSPKNTVANGLDPSLSPPMGYYYPYYPYSQPPPVSGPYPNQQNNKDKKHERAKKPLS